MGYRTLDTKNGYHKPILNGYKLLKKLGTELIPVQTKTDKHIFSFATKDENKISVVVVNYQDEHPFNDGISKMISLQVKPHWTASRNVTVKHWRIDEKHSNAYTVFKELGSPKLPDPMQIDAIKQRMDLELMETPQQIKSKDKINLKFYLPCNSVSLIEFIQN
jgi:xylan 1,4-beta-xylosidase